MTEFTGLDLEMAVEEHYHEVVEFIDGLLRFMFSELKARYSKEIEAVRQQFPSKDFTFPDKTVILKYREGLEMLRADGVELEHDADINTENEKRLGRLVKAKYDTDYYILDKFPIALRPFYTMPDPEDPVSVCDFAVSMGNDQQGIKVLIRCRLRPSKRPSPTRTTSSCEERRSCRAPSVSTTHLCSSSAWPW